VRWVLVARLPPATKPRWECHNSPPSAAWNWWGDCAGEAWACGDSSAEIGLGWFNASRAVHRRWSAVERASYTLGSNAERKVSSTLQELRCLTSALEHWIANGPEPASVLNYFSDARNIRHLLKKGRSPKAAINVELRRIHALCMPLTLHVRVFWHPRSCWAGVLADCLSRGQFEEFRKQSAAFGSQQTKMHPCL
jgi:hypothetical protein